MKAHLSIAMLLVASGACGGGNGGSGDDDGPDPTADAKVFMDAPGTVPTMITISGNASERGFSGTSPVDGVATAVFSSADDATPLATTTTDGQGNYSVTITLNGSAFDGYVKATKSGYVDLYLYPTAALTTDFADASFNMITPSNMNALSNIADGGQQAGKGLIGLAVIDASGQPVAGAQIASTPASGAYRYMGSNGFPSSSATETADDGVAFMFNAPGGEITITATKSGTTFKSHVVKARPDTFTSTAIAP